MKIFNISIYNVLIIFVFILLLLLPNINYLSVKSTLNIFLENVFPSLFPFIFFTEVILKTSFLTYISNNLSCISNIFKIHKNCTIAILCGYLCGFPLGAKVTNELYKNKLISKHDTDILMSFVNNASPIFIITTISISILNNISLGIVLLISHYLSSFIIGIVYSRYNIIHENTIKLNSNVTNYFKSYTNIYEIIKISISNTFKTLITILSFMILFNILSDIINNFCNVYLLTGMLEMTKGIYNTNNIYIISYLLSFSGLCIIFQIKSMLEFKFSIEKIIIFKFIQGILSVIITYVILLI